MDTEFLRHDTPECFHTRRLRLEKIVPEHATVLREAVLRSQPGLQYVDWAQGRWDLAQAQRFCRNSREAMDRDGRFLTYLVFELTRRAPDAPIATRGRYVGLLDLHEFDFDLACCQLGYVGDVALRGRGLLREAAAALVAQAHAWGVHRVEAWCDARNERSLRFAQGLGFQLEGRLRHAARDRDGAWCDQVVLAHLVSDPLAT